MWIPNSITLIIIFATTCTAIKKAWVGYQARRYKHFNSNYYTTEDDE